MRFNNYVADIDANAKGETLFVRVANRSWTRSWRLDLDDVGAEVGQDHGGAWSRDEARQIHDL
jgi:hypothetical protein